MFDSFFLVNGLVKDVTYIAIAVPTPCRSEISPEDRWKINDAAFFCWRMDGAGDLL
jgi:hypothetical protein